MIDLLGSITWLAVHAVPYRRGGQYEPHKRLNDERVQRHEKIEEPRISNENGEKDGCTNELRK